MGADNCWTSPELRRTSREPVNDPRVVGLDYIWNGTPSEQRASSLRPLLSIREEKEASTILGTNISELRTLVVWRLGGPSSVGCI